MNQGLRALLLTFFQVSWEKKDEILRAWKARVYDAAEHAKELSGGKDEAAAKIYDVAIEDLVELQDSGFADPEESKKINDWINTIDHDRKVLRGELVA